MIPRIATQPAVPTLARAREFQQAGRLDEAARLYRAILDDAADHLEALYLAGAAALGLVRHCCGLGYLTKLPDPPPQRQDGVGVCSVGHRPDSQGACCPRCL